MGGQVQPINMLGVMLAYQLRQWSANCIGDVIVFELGGLGELVLNSLENGADLVESGITNVGQLNLHALIDTSSCLMACKSLIYSIRLASLSLSSMFLSFSFTITTIISFTITTDNQLLFVYISFTALTSHSKNEPPRETPSSNSSPSPS